MDYPKYNGNYVGIVLQNNDPQYRGRVKVFVPHISPTVYKGWNDTNEDKNFSFIGALTTNETGTTTDSISGLTTGTLTKVLDNLKNILPWAEMAAPLAGGGASGRYNATTGLASISDSSNIDYTEASPISNYSQNSDNIGEKPGNVYDIALNKLSDAFNNPQLTNVNNVNKLSYEYVPETYSNSAKGSFPVLNVGAHVWVFFNEGDPLKPVVFGLSYGANDWSTIFDASSGNPGTDYPGTYENINKDDVSDINVRTYRNKYVINQKGGTISFVNTDNREVLKMTHYSGSFKEFNNLANIELATGNDQKLVLNDSFSTVRGSRNEFTQRDLDNVIVGDHYRKVGNLQHTLHQQWKSIMEQADIPNIKQLFDIQRTAGVTSLPKDVDGLIKLNGKGQTKHGNPYLCPLCSANEQNILALNNTFGPEAYSIVNNTPGYSSSFGDQQFGFGITLKGLVPSLSFGGNNPLKFIFGSVPFPQIISNGATLTDSDGKTLTMLPGTLGQGIPCPVCNPSSPFNKDIAKVPGITLRPGYSPSSFHGAWAKEPKKNLLPSLYQSVVPRLAQVEAQMGLGGSEIIEVTKHKIETIGMVMNDWGAIRVDPLGKMSPAFVAVTPYMPVTVQRPTPLIEQVQVDDLPGGTYTLNVCNKYNILVGAGGVNLKSYGVVNITGAMTNIAGEQVNIGSANEVNVDGGKRLNLVGDIVSIKQRYGEQVLMDSSVGVTGNLIVKGGIFVEGNLTALSVSTPQIVRQGDQAKVTGRGKTRTTIGVAIPVDTPGTLDETGTLKPAEIPGLTTIPLGYTDTTSIIGYVGGVISPATAVYGSGPTFLSLRGLPPLAVKAIQAQIELLGDTGATKPVPYLTNVLAPPMIVVGAGADPDGIEIHEHSHTQSTGDAPSHAYHRAEFASHTGNVPTKSEAHGPNISQNEKRIQKEVAKVMNLAKGLGGILQSAGITVPV